MTTYRSESRVEERALERSGRAAWYPPTEKIRIVEVPDFPSLGQLAALRFIEWLQKNPGGPISLPTGKTPEHFIGWTTRYLSGWRRKTVAAELAEWGIDPGRKPDLRSHPFVQIDEFYPMDPARENSFAFYIRRYYIEPFGLDPAKALLMDAWTLGAPAGRTLGAVFPDGLVDLSLRYRQPADEREALQLEAILAADQQAMEFEGKVRELGGIGFFLGGIGPDGHIGFNIRGSDHFSTTRLTPINYETAAAAAGDLGGIEVARRKAVVTVGLRTIAENPTTTAIVIAAGEAKARVVRDAVESRPTIAHPATALQRLDAARFYLTRGAASLLLERRCRDLAACGDVQGRCADRVLVDIAFKRRKRLVELEGEDLAGDRLGRILLERGIDLPATVDAVRASFAERIGRGRENLDGMTFLHTAPHHDDIMLGYLPYIIHLVRNPRNAHHFATLTSGFTSVTGGYALGLLRGLGEFLAGEALRPLIAEGYFSPGNALSRNRDIYQYLDGVAAGSAEMQREAEARRTLRNLVEIAGTEELDALKKELRRLVERLERAHPGEKDAPAVQTLKGMIREWEEELLWAHLGFGCENIVHLRLGFYTGDIFTPQPEYERDVQPVLALMERLRPDVVTVALDPEGSGPDTHYKVLQTVAEALGLYRAAHPDREVRVWGYRNVWYRFHPAEADIFVPVSMNSLAIMKSAFNTCFGSQRSASFPSHEYDGPFSDLAQRVMVEQYAVVKTCLGRDFFHGNAVPRLRATRGLALLRAMTPDEFIGQARSLRALTERGGDAEERTAETAVGRER